MKNTRLAVALSTLLSSGAALAHPGHSSLARSFGEWLHLATSSDHLPALAILALLGIGIGGAVVQRLVRKEGRRDPR